MFPDIPLDKGEFLRIPIRHLHASYTPLEASEKNSITREIDKTRRIVATYDPEIVRLRRSLLRLESEREWLQTHEYQCSSILSPIRRLPWEILTQIFSYLSCNPGLIQQSCDVSKPERRLVNLKLERVCKYWMKIMRSTPILWSQIYLPLDDMWKEDTLGHNFDSARIRRPLNVYLRRSKQRSLSITVRFPESEAISLSERENSLSLWKALCDHSPRWEELRIFNFPSYAFNFLPGGGESTSLQVFHLHVPFRRPQTPHSFRMSSPLCLSPKLKVYRHTGRVPIFSGPSAYRFTDSVTVLSLGCEDLSEVHICSILNSIEITGRCPVLQKLSLKCHHTHSTMPMPQDAHHVYSTTITSLTLESSVHSYRLWHFLRILTLPNLKTLVLKNSLKPPGNALTSFIQRSGCAIEALTLEDVLIDNADLISALGMMFLVRDLTYVLSPTWALYVSYWNVQKLCRGWIRSLTLPSPGYSIESEDSPQILLPRLAHLHISSRRSGLFNATNAPILLEMIKSRFRSGAPQAALKRLTLPAWMGRSPAFPGFRDLGNEGLKITYQKYSSKLP